MNDYVSAFWIRADLEDPVFIGDEVRRWPANIRHLFESHSLIRQSENLDVVECDACGDGHVEEVEILTEPPGTKPRAYISCPEAGRVSVEFERLYQWSIDLEALAQTVAAALDLRDRIVSITPGRVWLLGTRKFVERMRDVFLVRGITWEDSSQILESATRLANSPCPLIFCLNRIPDDPEWQEHNRVVLSLSETSWLGDQQYKLLDKVSGVLSEYADAAPRVELRDVIGQGAPAEAVAGSAQRKKKQKPKALGPVTSLDELQKAKSILKSRAAREFRVDTRTIYNWIANGEINTTQAGRVITTDQEFERKYRAIYYYNVKY